MDQALPYRASGEIGASGLHRDRTVFCMLLGLYFLVLYPILRAERFYNDDLKRALMGRTGWDSNGRFLTTFAMKLTQFYDHALVDISPFTQFAAIAMLAWVGVQLARRYAIRTPWLAALVALPLGAQPFFMENLSYKFDALSMGLALLLVLQPIVRAGKTRREWWIGVLAIFASLNFYQPAINVLLVFALADVVLELLEGKKLRDVRSALGWRASQIGVGMLAYELIIGVHVSSWVKQHAEMISHLRDLPMIGSNFLHFYTFIWSSFNVHWWMYCGPILLLLGLIPVIVGVRYTILDLAGGSASARALLIALSLLWPVMAMALALGPMLLLVNPLVIPRVLVGVGGLLSAGLFVLQAAFRRWDVSEKCSLAVSGVLAMGMLVFANAYGNAEGQQKSYEQAIAVEIANDLSELRATRPINSYLIDGTDGLSPIAAHVGEQLPLVKTLVHPYLSGKDVFFTHYFLLSYLPATVDLRHLPGGGNPLLQASILARTCYEPAVRISDTYRMFLIDETAVVAFAAAHQARCSARKMDATIPPNTSG